MSMDTDDLMARAREALQGRLVYSEPVEQEGAVVIPAARVRGGGGGGSGPDGEGRGMGLGFDARPVGAFVIRGDETRWVPAVDVNRIVVAIAAASVLALFLLRR